MTSVKALCTIFGLVAIGGCGPEIYVIEELEEKSTAVCELAVDCDEEARPETMKRCVDGFVEYGEESYAVGVDCAKTFDRIMTCLAPLSCSEFDRWGLMADERPCETETGALISICPGVWFVPEDQP